MADAVAEHQRQSEEDKEDERMIGTYRKESCDTVSIAQTLSQLRYSCHVPEWSVRGWGVQTDAPALPTSLSAPRKLASSVNRLARILELGRGGGGSSRPNTSEGRRRLYDTNYTTEYQVVVVL